MAVPPLSKESWTAAADCAKRAIPVLMEKGLFDMAALMGRRRKLFERNADAVNQSDRP